MDILELALRLGAAISMTAAFWVLVYSIDKGDGKGRVPWVYLLFVVGGKSLFRWIILGDFMGFFPSEVSGFLDKWQVPINQSLYILMGIAVMLLVYAHRQGVAQHASQCHIHGKVVK